MPFGLTNAAATFQHFINDTLFEYLDIFCTAFINDILIYSDTLEAHEEQVWNVLKKLKRPPFSLNQASTSSTFKKPPISASFFLQKASKWTQKSVYYNAMATPKTVTQGQEFIGFDNFYQRFIMIFTKVCTPMTALTRKDTLFNWNTRCEDAFQTAKTAFCTAPILTHFDAEEQVVVETDTSNYISAGILSQHDDQGVRRPVAFFSKKHSPAECNYEIYDNELLAIIMCFEEWRPELEGSAHPMLVISDHKNLEYFMNTKKLNWQQARWSEFLSRFGYRIVFRPGKQGGKPDALTSRSGDLPKEGDERLFHQSQTILKKQNLDRVEAKSSLFAGSLTNQPAERESSLEVLIMEGYETGPLPKKVLKMIQDGTR